MSSSSQNKKSVVRKAIKGDTAAFTQLMEDRKENLYRIAYSYVKNQADALDIVSETVYKAYLNIRKVKKPQYFNTWLTRILINNAINQLKKQQRVVYMGEKEALDNVQQAADIPSFYEREQVLDLYRAIDRLDADHKTVVILKYFQDFTFDEIAQVLEWPSGTVKTYLYRALKSLNVDLGEEVNNE